MAKERPELQVWLDAPEICKGMLQIGTLYPDWTRTDLPAAFEYTDVWLERPECFMIDPKLDLYQGAQHSLSNRGFGIFLDSAPDRWGSKLIQRREVMRATKEGRQAKMLSPLELMLGVHDLTRSGALRFCEAPNRFLDDDASFSAPPITSLAKLAAVARELDDDRAENRPEYEQWLSLLVAPGSSLGGARPKAVFREGSGALWLAKFPGKKDAYDWGLWEFLTHNLARAAKIDVPPSRLQKYGDEYHTFCVKRFDRGVGEDSLARRMYTSAMTLLERNDGDDGSYLDLVQILEDIGGKGLTQDLHQMFRRAVFNLLMGNRDDHLRNHGFIYTESGWRLSPAFDMNPNPAKGEHALSWDGINPVPNIDVLWNTYPYYRLSANEAQAILDEVLSVVATWRQEANRLNASRVEIEMMSAVIQTDI